MNASRILITSIAFFAVFMFLEIPVPNAIETPVQNNTEQLLDFNKLSETFLAKVKNHKNTQEIQNQLAHTSLDALATSLNTDEKKLAFWINVYNGYIQVILSENPELYKDRSVFFNEERIQIAGELISFAKIEHGIIRKSQWSLGLGMVRKWFPNRFERKLRASKRDYRIHFALNCGAKDCPPVSIYQAEHLNEQLNKNTKQYLKKTTTYDATKNEVAITSLFSWFRGDFGSKNKVKNILKNHRLIPTTNNVSVVYKNYDWTLDLDNWSEK